MTPSETVVLTRYVKACCPQQAIDEYTPDAWYDLLDDLEFADCKTAATAVAKRQPFVAPAEIRAEVRRTRSDRLARELPPAIPHELTDEPGRYRAELKSELGKIADGFSVPRAIGGPVREDEPPETWAQARAGFKTPPTPQEIALHQAAESRAAREAARPDEGEPAA
jgi:hypothetical protein